MFYNCKEATKAQVKKEESRISFGEKTLLHIHLLHCKWCRRFAKQSSLIQERIRVNQEEITGGKYLISYSEEQKKGLEAMISRDLGQ